MAKKPSSSTPITSLKHTDTRANIPTEELRDFVADEERSPKTVLYPRDPSLDPQLVWKGKDEQDREDLAVPAVPIYIQEKVSPQAIIENVRAQAKKDQPAPQLSLFADFNNITFEDQIDFYHHEQNWTNRMILGDSLLVMTSLAEKEGLKGQVQMIYMDPPYGIKFGSNWQVSTRKRDVKDGKIEDATRQPEQIKAFRDTWQLGIHSYLSYLRDRLVVARELLTESGSCFVQISDENVHHVREVMDEIFGQENFITQLIFKKTGSMSGNFISGIADTILWYGKNKDHTKFRELKVDRPKESADSGFPMIELTDGSCRRLSNEELERLVPVPDGRRFQTSPVMSSGDSEKGSRSLIYQGKEYKPSPGRHWSISVEELEIVGKNGRLYPVGNTMTFKKYLDESPYVLLSNIWMDTMESTFAVERYYVVQTAKKVIERCVLLTSDPGDIILDPTCGSGTTAYVAEQWGRRWITVDTSRVSIALARTRLMSGRYPYYLLADSPEGIRKEAELIGQAPSSPLQPTANDVKKGFVYHRVPHITLKSIASNEEAYAIHARYQVKLEQLRMQINQAAEKDWQEWEIPREAAGELNSLLMDWWKLHREQQKEIDSAIARHADPEHLYDQPYEDNKRIRVTGPFTVESLSPYRVLSTDEERPESEVLGQQQPGTGQFEAMIINNLRAAGVQNTVKNERLKFTHLEPYAGIWLQAVGEYTEKDGAVKRVAVTIGPEHGTVGPDLIKDAAKEAVQGLGFDLLVVLGFAFDPHVSEESKRYGKLTVLPARINPDLQMGGALLKNTGYGNLFMVFGEPDIAIQNQPDGQMTVTIKGVDVYDPTTGEIRSSSTDDIACWFIDTNYNGESFFVRHAYFTGADEPYEKLKRALRAEIDEAAWNSLYSTTSYPFEKPETGKIAVKVINHYGDEVLKVYKI